MARSRDASLNIPITSTFDGRGFKSAQSSAAAMEREFTKQENQQRSRVQMQMQAEREMLSAQQQREQQQRASYRMQAQAEREMNAELKAQAEVRERLNEQQRTAMESTGKWVLGISAAGVAGLGLATKAAIDWESAWAGVTKTVDGTQEELSALEGDLRRMARSLPASHQEIAAVAEAAGQLGVATKDVAAFSETMIHLGETTNMTADEAATAIAQFSNIMGTSTDDVARLGSTVVALGNNSATTERHIVLMSQRIAGSAAVIGLTEAQTLSLASALASVGIEVEAGGTAISRVMTDIAKAVDLGGEGLEGFSQVAGMSAEEFARAFREDPADAIVSFIEGLGQINDAGGSVFQTLDDLGMSDVRVSRALLGMANAGDLLRESLDLGNQAWDENIALIEEANQRYQTTEARMQMARNQINDAAIDIGQTFLPMIGQAADVVSSLSAAWGALPDGVKQWVTYLGAAATGIGLVSGAAMIAVPKLHAFRLTVDALHGGTSRLGRMAGGLATVLTGPWGLAVAGAVVIAGLWAKAQGEAVQEAEELRNTLDQQTGAITENTRAWAAKKAQDEGWLDTAALLGVRSADLVDAMIGEADAARRVEDALSQLEVTTNDYGIETYRAADGTQVHGDKLATLRIAIADTNEDLDEQAHKQRQLADATGEGADAAEGGAEAQEILAGAMGETVDEAEALENALDAIIESMRALNQPTLSLIDAQIAWEATLDEVNEQLKENGRTLDINTEKGRANQSFLNDMARDAMALAEAILEETGSETEFRTSLEQSRKSLMDTAREFGATKAEAREYADSVLAIPDSAYVEIYGETDNLRVALNRMLVEIDSASGAVTIDGKTVDAEQTLGELIGNVNESDGTVRINGEKVPAEVTLADLLAIIDGSKEAVDILGDDLGGRATLQAFVNKIIGTEENVKIGADTSNAHAALNRLVDGIHGRTVTVYGRVRQLGQAELADGGVMEFYGNGGVRRENHVAQIAPAGTWRVWAEPETGGEAYIPLAPSKRARSEDILGEVAHRFGMYVGRYANGGIVGGSAPVASAQVGGVVNNIYGVPVDQAEEVASEITWAMGALPAVTGYAGGGS